MIEYMRVLILKIAKPFLVAIGRFHLPGSVRKITQAQVEDYIMMAEVGDIVLAKKKFELTNMFIKGKYKHAAFLSSHAFIEAVDPVAKRTGVYDFFLMSDEIVVCRPKGFTFDQLAGASVFAENTIGHKYDYQFADGNEDYYCSELCYEALKSGRPDWGFKRRKILGKYNVQPDDFRLADKYFDVIWSSKK